MYYVRTIILIFVFILSLAGCGGGIDSDVFDDLDASGDDKRPVVEAGSSGTQDGQVSPDFTVQDSLDISRTLSTELASSRAVVLYFTMWCPICDAHMSNMRAHIMPDFPNVRFFFVDYVSGSISVSRSEQLANGYGTSEVLVDVDLELTALYEGTMGTTIVIDSAGVIGMNEDYKDGVKLRAVLDALP